MNIKGQTGLNPDKETQKEDFLNVFKCDLLHLQEINIDCDSFKANNYINSNFYIVSNNAKNKYGTSEELFLY